MPDTETLVTTKTKKNEIETIMIVTEITELKNRLLDILSKYNVQKPDDIERKIINNEISEHPSYEDYLSALSYKQTILDLKKKLKGTIEEIGRI